MNQYKENQQFQSQEKHKEQYESQCHHGKPCPNCGNMCSEDAMFCEECGAAFGSGVCTSCGATVQPHWEICPSCGKPLHKDTCSFCGAHIAEGCSFCPECGNPCDGIECPHCHTLNFRSFCRNCNEPLNGMAFSEVEKARNDPKYQYMVALAQELAQLEEQILAAQEESEKAVDEGETPAPPQISDEDKALIERYRNLINSVRKSPIPPSNTPSTPTASPAQQQTKERKKIKLNTMSVEETMKIYKSKVAEMQKTMQELIPDPGMTPQEQRNYYSARKLPVVTTTRKRVPEWWVCNFCGCYHRQPSECAEPGLGGTWLYNDITVTEKTYQYEK